MKFIKSSNHEDLINLEKVNCMSVKKETREILFVFDSVNADTINQIKWDFIKDEEGFIDAINEIERVTGLQYLINKDNKQ